MSSPATAERIHTASMAILEKAGIRIDHPEICTLLRKCGVRVDNRVAYWVEHQIMSWVGKAPAAFTLHARNPVHDAVIGAGQPQYAPGYGCAEVADAAGRRRSATLEDYLRFVQLVQQSEGFRINGGILVQPAELPGAQTHAAMAYAALLFSDKCLMGQPGHAEAVEKIMTMAAMVFGGRQALLEKPAVLTLVNTHTPLQLDHTTLDTIRIHAGYGQPLLIAAGLMSGTTAPITPAGSLALGNAEVLAAIAVSQMLREGTPVVMGLIVSPADMRTGDVRLGVPNHTACIRYTRALADLYGLPCRCGGCLTDAGGLTHQSGYESMLNILATLQARVDLIIHSAGILSSFKAMSFEKFVADLEVIRIAERHLAELPIGDDALALAVIEEVGPGGEFLTHPHTLARCRSVPYTSLLKSARNRPAADAQEAYRARVESALENMLSTYRQPDLPPSLRADLESYLIAEGVDSTHLKKFADGAVV